MHPDRTVSGRSTSPTSPFLRAANAPPGPPRRMSRFKWDMGLGGFPCPDYCCTGTCYRGCLLVCRDRQALVGASLVASQTCLERVTQHRLVDEAASATSAVSRYASFSVLFMCSIAAPFRSGHRLVCMSIFKREHPGAPDGGPVNPKSGKLARGPESLKPLCA